MLEALKRAFALPELRKKLLFMVGMLLAFRALAAITIPGANPTALQSLFSGNTFLGLLNIFSGGGLSQFSIVSLGLNPYINATIMLQLMQQSIPRLRELALEGEQGSRKINRYARWLTVPLALLQSYGVIVLFENSQVLSSTTSATTVLTIMLILLAGTLITMWLGELITEYGIGQGISLIIFAGIISRVPFAVTSYGSLGGGHIIQIFGMGVIALVVIALSILMQQGQRRIPVQSMTRVTNPRSGTAQRANRTNLPIPVTAGGVIPIIFAISFMLFPATLGSFVQNAPGWIGELGKWFVANWSPNGGPIVTQVIYNVFYFVLVIAFTYFYAATVIFNADDMSDQLKRSAMYVPGIRPGPPTSRYLAQVRNRVVFVGGLFLAAITVVLPLLTSVMTGVSTTSLYLGGTSILIVVWVALDTMRQIEAQLQMRDYQGFIR